MPTYLDNRGCGRCEPCGEEEPELSDEILIADGESLDYDKGCSMGSPAVQYFNLPYTLEANVTYQLRFYVNSMDPLFHVGAYYAVDIYGATLAEFSVLSNRGGGSWSPFARQVRFDFNDSSNCGGSGGTLQVGNAVALIPSATSSRTLRIEVRGSVEHHDAGYDKIWVYISPAAGSWRIRETGAGITYDSGYPQSTIPATFTPPTYSYTGYMVLQIFKKIAGEGTGFAWVTVKSWTVINGGPTVSLP